MHIAVTGATGFLGRYIVRHLAAAGHRLRCWHRPGSDRVRAQADYNQALKLDAKAGKER